MLVIDTHDEGQCTLCQFLKVTFLTQDFSPKDFADDLYSEIQKAVSCLIEKKQPSK